MSSIINRISGAACQDLVQLGIRGVLIGAERKLNSIGLRISTHIRAGIIEKTSRSWDYRIRSPQTSKSDGVENCNI
jgi:hypothetical protein